MAYYEQLVTTRTVGLRDLYEQRGNREKAIEYYGKFVDLWTGADAELQPVVNEVTQRLARLVGER